MVSRSEAIERMAVEACSSVWPYSRVTKGAVEFVVKAALGVGEPAEGSG